MQQAGLELLEAMHYRQYEISAFAQADKQSRHNMNYWRYGDFLAVGAGAHGKITIAAEGSVQRFAKHRHPKRYLQGLRTGIGVRKHVFEVKKSLCLSFF